MENEVKEYYDRLQDACKDGLPLKVAYRQLRELLEQLCYTQMADGSLQMTDLSARISYVAAKVGLTVVEQNRLHTFRLTSNRVLNHEQTPVREELLRDVKTLAFFVKRLTHESIPEALYRLLPHADATYVAAPMGSRVKRMRVCFQYADATYLYVQPLDSLADEWLKVRYNVPGVNEEFKETCELLWRHAQINLLDVVVDGEGVLTPSFIILEPDYLIDISSLAECFKDYGHHPANYILARFQPSDNACSLLLGNIVNLFLDEWIHAESEPDYLACMKKAFRAYQLELATCEELRDAAKERQFFANCRLHFENIRRTVNETFPAPGYGLDKSDAVLEPSYICEALGLQGRLDYMQRDMSAFIEMKSGRADEYAIRGKVEPKENNRVQMLLYQAVLEYAMGMDHRQVKAYLFYTRYPLLYPARPSWAMVRRVMNVRNRIVEAEYGIQLRNSIEYTAYKFKDLQPAVLNERKLAGKFWRDYLCPPILRFAEKLAALSPLEKNYFYTLYNFITKELYTSKSGDVEALSHTGAASLWRSTLDEKCEAGEILYDLTVQDNHAAAPSKPYLLLTRRGGAEEALANFRIGDAVVLYERNSEQDNVTNRMVFKGNVECVAGQTIRLRLRASQRNAGVLPSDSRYAMEHDYMDTTFRSMYQGLSLFLSATKGRRDLLLGHRGPAFDESFDGQIDVAADDFDRVILKARAARDYFLLMGPPGTGKTSCALRGMVEAFYGEGRQILLLSYTNRAVDEICKALSAITPGLDYIRLGSELTCEETYRPHLMEHVLEDCANRREVQERIRRCRVFVGTVATLSAKTCLFLLKRFDVALVDEATQILEPQLLGLLCARSATGEDAIGKFVLIGDHKQLPAVVQQASEHSEVHDEELRRLGICNLKDSLFERLYRRLTSRGDGGGDPEASRFHDMLRRQGRMNEDVAQFPNRAFYGGQLEVLGLAHQRGKLELVPCLRHHPLAPVLTRRVAFLPSEADAGQQSVKMNASEARIVAALSEAVYRQYTAEGTFSPGRTLGIIAPYRSQVALIKSELAALRIPALDEVMVDTVERFQGSERDVIIYSCCVNRAYQLKFLSNLTEEQGVLVDRKLNVALTRARKQMFITGVPRLLALHPVYAELLRFCKN